jgi:hypothetical protein
MLKRIRTILISLVVLAAIVAVGYLYLQSMVHTITFGPTAQAILDKTNPQERSDGDLQNDSDLRNFVIEVLKPVFRDLHDRYSVGMPYEDNYQFKRTGEYFRIMGSAPRGNKETVVFVIVLREGKQVFIEVGKLYTEGSYPQGVFE